MSRSPLDAKGVGPREQPAHRNIAAPYRWAAAALLAAGAFVMGQRHAPSNSSRPGDIVSARGFAVVDQEGRRRAFFGFDAQNYSIGQLYNKSGNPVIDLSCTADGRASITMGGTDKEQGIIYLEVDADGSPSLWLHSMEAEAYVAMSFEAEGVPSICLSNDNGLVRLALAEAELGDAEKLMKKTKRLGPGLELFDDKSALRASLTLNGTNDPQIELYDSNGGRLWRAPEK